MAQINLLPAVAEKRRKPKIELDIKLEPVIFSFVGLLVIVIIVWAILGIRLSSQRKKLTHLDEQLSSLKFNLEKLNKLEEDKETLLDKLEFLDRKLKRGLLWAKGLNQISNLVPPGIWLKDIVLHTKKEDHLSKYEKLDIGGSAISLRGEEMMDLIGGFMTALKKDEVFSGQFSEIKLISSQRSKKAAKFDVMDFKLSCQFK